MPSFSSSNPPVMSSGKESQDTQPQSAASSSYSSSSTPSISELLAATQEMMQTFRAFMAKQDAINSKVEARQDDLVELLQTQPEQSEQPEQSDPAGAATTVTAEPDVDEDARERELVRKSRASITFKNSNNTLYSPPHVYTQPQVRPRTTEELARRSSHGILSTPVSSARAAHPSTAISATPSTSSAFPAPLDKQRNSPYDRVATLLGRRDLWYGDRKHDKDIDVYAFVRAVEHTMNMWMAGEPRGRLDLVISCTAGPAQQWLLNKKQDCDTLIVQGVKPENADWDVVKSQFMEQMGGGQMQRLYQSRLESLVMGKGGGEDVMKFITQFTEYSMRAYPLDKHPDTEVRSLMLGKVFGERVAASDLYVWQEAMRAKPPPEKLQDWEQALTSAWSTENTIREQRKKQQNLLRVGRNDVSAFPSAQRVNNMEAGGELGDYQPDDSRDEQDAGAALNVVAAAAPARAKKPRNQFLAGNRDAIAKLIKAQRCLLCYKKDHYASACTAPANRAPTPAELN